MPKPKPIPVPKIYPYCEGGLWYLRPPVPRPPSGQLRTRKLLQSKVSRRAKESRELLASLRSLDPLHTLPAIFPDMLDHAVTMCLPSFIKIPRFPVFQPPGLPPSPPQAQLTLTPGFLAPTTPRSALALHIAAIPSHFIDAMASSAPECLEASRIAPQVPWQSTPPPLAWHTFSETGLCRLLAYTPNGAVPIAKAPCAGRLIQVAYALSLAKCGLRLLIPRAMNRYHKTPYDTYHPITSLSVENLVEQ